MIKTTKFSRSEYEYVEDSQSTENERVNLESLGTAYQSSHCRIMTLDAN